MKIYDARVNDVSSFRRTLLVKLSHYRKKAPYFESVINLVRNTFDSPHNDSLTLLNVASLSNVCLYLDIPFHPQICSELCLPFPKHMGRGDWAPFIAKSLGASSYVNPIGGKDLFSVTDFRVKNIELYFAKFGDFSYPTPGYNFVSGLSILDVLMWVPPEEVRAAAYEHMELVPAS